MTHAMTSHASSNGVRHMIEEDYHQHPALSQSRAKLLLPPSTPAKFKHDLDSPPKIKKSWDFGRVAHKLVLGEGDQFLVLDPAIHGLKADNTPTEQPTSTSAWKKAVANARAEGLTPIHVDDYQKAVAMAQVVHAHPIAGPLLSDGRAEVSMFADDPHTGTPLRGRADWMGNGKTIDRGDRLVVADYKSTVDANPETWHKQVMKFSYHLQFAWYVTLAQLLKLDQSPLFLNICQEKEPPYEVSVNELDADFYKLGREAMQQAITTYARCKEADEWPGYAPIIHQTAPPLWAFDDDEMEIPA